MESLFLIGSSALAAGRESRINGSIPTQLYVGWDVRHVQQRVGRVQPWFLAVTPEVWSRNQGPGAVEDPISPFLASLSRGI